MKLFRCHPEAMETQKLSGLFPAEKYPRLARALQLAFNEQANWTGEFEHQAADGTKLWVHAAVSPIRERKRCSHVVCVVTDITNMKQAFDEMAHLAAHDVLTGLLNRRLFNELLEQATHLARRDAGHYAMLYLDLDGFKEINDTLGHSAGDQLLVKLAERLKGSVRESDVVARVGGDEFIVLLQNIDSRSDVEHTTINILTRLSRPMKISGHPVRISASAGIAIIPDDGLDPDRLIRRADLALYQGKSFGGNSYHFFSKEMEKWDDS